MSDQQYSAAVAKGKELLAAMKASPSSPTSLSIPSVWTSHDALLLNGWDREEDPEEESRMYEKKVEGKEFTQVMSSLNISTSRAHNELVSLTHARPSGRPNSCFAATGADYIQLFNAISGAIVTLGMDSPFARVKLSTAEFDGTEIPTDRPVLHRWSDVTFLQWQEIANKTVKGLKWVVQCEITNELTKRIMLKLIEETEKSQTGSSSQHVSQEFTEEQGDAFLALLGSPNGYGTAYMLAQHKAQLGQKIVKSITIHRGKDLTMVLEVGDI